MTTAEITARANQKAHDRHIHVMAVAGRPGVYQVSSKSEPGTKQTLVVQDSVVACSCKGFLYRKSCCHSEALYNRLAREAVASTRRA